METVKVELAPNEKRCSKCKEVKDRSEFSTSSSRGKRVLYSLCRPCKAAREKDRQRKQVLTNDPTALKCPFCGFYFSHLGTHLSREHKKKSSELAQHGLNTSYSKQAYAIVSKAQSRPRPELRIGAKAQMKDSCVTFPKDFWPSECKYAKVVILKEKLQIQFNPTIPKLPNTKVVFSKKNGSARLSIHLHKDLFEGLQIMRPIIKLREGAGFYIQFYEEDYALFNTFEVWAKSYNSMRNLADLSFYSGKNGSNVSIADHIWPLNAEYCFFEYVKSNRKNVPDYFDILPVSRTGFIVNSKKLDFKQYIGIEECSKIRRPGKTSKRLASNGIGFVNKYNIPPSDWDLKEILPSGALRFRLYKERQPNQRQDQEQQEAS